MTNETQDVNEIVEKMFRCETCEKEYKSNQGLEEHIQSFHLNTKFECGTCEKSFTIKKVLKEHHLHFNDKSEKIFRCDICQK